MSQKRSLLRASSTSRFSAGARARAGVGRIAGRDGCEAARPRYSVALETARALQAGARPTLRDSPSADSISSLLLAPGSPGLSPGALILFFARRLWSQPA